MGDHREEVQAGLAHLLFLFFVQSLHLTLVTLFFTTQTEMHILPDDTTQQQEIENLGIPAPPEGGLDDDLERSLIGGPHTVVVRSLHAERIGSGRQVGICCLILIPHIVPVVVEALQHIGVFYLLWRAIAQRGKRQADHLGISVAYGDLFRQRQV